MDRTFAWVIAVAIAAAAATYELKQIIYADRRLAVNDSAPAPIARPLESGKSAVSSARPGSSCRVADLRLSWPLDGVADKDWVIANYFDEDPATGRTRDYTGAIGTEAVTYDAHTGVDIEVPSFRAVDLDVPVLASADGIVEEAFDQSPDHNMTCSSETWNHVTLRHANGFATLYGHMKKHSIPVKIGDRVRAGQKVGVVGSSGCSSYPHVHLEVTDCTGNPLDSVKEKMFRFQPEYSRNARASVMETHVFQPAIDAVIRIQDPGPEDIRLVSVGHPFSAAMTVAHLRAGDVVRIEFITPENSRAPFSFEQKIDRYFTRSHWWGDFVLDAPGPWLVQFKVNGQTLAERPILAGE